MSIISKFAKKTPGNKLPVLKNRIFIFGLGNPEKEYENTRHNAGKDTVLLFAKRLGLEFQDKKDLFSQIANGNQGKRKIVTALPSLFMNNSGKAISAIANFYKAKPEEIVVVHDDMDLPLGKIKIVFNRGSGGHKGVESIFEALRAKNFTRIRVGTMSKSRSQKPGQRALENIVLKRLTPDEKLAFAQGLKKAAAALKSIAENGVEAAMNELN